MTLILLLQQKCRQHKDEEDVVLSLPTSGETLAAQEDSGARCAAPCSPGSARAPHPTLTRPRAAFELQQRAAGESAGGRPVQAEWLWPGREARSRAACAPTCVSHRHRPGASRQWSLCTTLRKDKRLTGCYLESLQRTLPARENGVKP